MTHLDEIANAQLVTIAKTAAYHCDEQHEYMKGSNHPDWQPHKWVITAMRAAVTIRNSEAEKQLHDALASLVLFTKPNKTNAVALNHAQQVLKNAVTQNQPK